ncbi:MAG: hypothetical protein EOO03_14020 [Chitinophagaceae bacterium]|nr:MAG: hypothetical protein EOO03_14020 [Chitinophagaceae bacterium]
MKHILLSAMVLCSLSLSAQKLNLKKGHTVTIQTTATQDIDMMAMQMKHNSTTTHILTIEDTDKEKISGTSQLSKTKLDMEVMGQQQSYDSENPADKDSEMGKALADKIGKVVPVTIDKNTGIVTELETETDKSEKAANPMESVMQSFSGADASASNAFYVIPNGKKAGDTWTDSSSNATIKEVKTYTLKGIEDGIATVQLFSTMSGSSSFEVQGMQMDVSLSAKTEGQMLVDVKTSQLKKRSSVMDMTGTMDIAGQSMPLTSKAIIDVIYK